MLRKPTILIGTALVMALCAPAVASAASGGLEAGGAEPKADLAPGAGSGGADTPGVRDEREIADAQRRAKRKRTPRIRRLALAPRRLKPGQATRLRFRIASRSRGVDVRLIASAPDGTRTVRKLGRQRTNVDRRARWRVPAGIEGRVKVKLEARDRDAAGRRTATVLVEAEETPAASPSPAAPVAGHAFPIAGAFGWGGRDARFGDDRGDHRHMGQDLTAAGGTPLVAVASGTISVSAYQAGGAGYYLVLDAVGEDRDYVYMHLRRGSLRVGEGDAVRAGQPIAAVGSTGRSSGPHLHFESWRGAWFAGGRAVDPLPALTAWARAGGLPLP